MKIIERITLILWITLLLISIGLLSIDVVDNRDYPDDGYEVYLLDTHIGYYYADDKEFEYSLTGK